MDHLPRLEYFAGLPKIPFAAGALFFNAHDDILLLRPTYRDGWMIPGGVAECGESPAEAVIREIREELGLRVQLLTLLCIDYKRRTADDFDDATIQFIFDGGILPTESITSIQLSQEHSAYQFVSVTDAGSFCFPSLARRLPACMTARNSGSVVYLEDGCRRW